MQEQHRLAMRADLRLARAEDPRPVFDELVARGMDVRDLVADVVDAAGRVLLEKAVDRAVLSQRVEQLDEDDPHPVIGLVLRRADRRAERASILRGRGLEVGHRDGDMVETSDHGDTPVTETVARYGPRAT